MPADWTMARKARWSLAAVVLLALVGGFVMARSAVADMRAALQTKLEVTARLRAVAAQDRQILAAPPSVQSAALAGDFLAGTQDAIIVAELQNRLRAVAIASEVELNSANALGQREIGGTGYLGLRVQLRGQLRDIQRVLHTVETGTPLLFVERLAMRVDTWPIKSADPTRDGAPALVAEMDIVGARAGAAPTSSAGDAAGGGGASVPWLSGGRRRP